MYQCHWKWATLGDVAIISSGGTPSRTNPAYWEGSIPWVTTGLVDFNLIDNAEEYITEDGLKNSAAKIYPAGTLLMALYGQGITRGKVAMLGIDAATNQACASIIPNPEINPVFLFYYLQGQYDAIRNIGHGGNQQNLSGQLIKEIAVPLPSLQEQDQLSQIIQQWDRSINLIERLITAKQERRTWLMQQLLTGRRRLPGFNKPWTDVHIQDIFKRVRRKNDKSISHVLTASGEHGLVDQAEYFNCSVAGVSLDGYYLLRRGEFAYNRSSMNGYPYGAIKRLDAYDEGVLSTLYLCFKLSSESCHSDFYKHLFEAGVLNVQLRKIVQVGARAHGLLNVTLRDFFALKVQCPPIEEQKKIASTIDVADRELELLRDQLDALREQKKGLMQQLLTGKRRVHLS